MKPAPTLLTAEESLKSFIRRAASDLAILRGTQYARAVAVPDTPYVLKQHGRPSGPNANWLRPINSALFIEDQTEYIRISREAMRLLRRLRRAGADPDERRQILAQSLMTAGMPGQTDFDRFLYTTVQASGCVYDVSNPNSQRPFGLLYQGFVHSLITYLGFSTSSLNILVPRGHWDTAPDREPEAKTKIERVEVDLVIGQLGQDVLTTPYSVWPEDSFATVKSSTKDRISQVFVDAIAIQQLSVWRIAKYILFVHNDVQRTGASGISWTFLPTNFTGGSRSFPLSGIYFSDMPGNVIAAKGKEEEWARLCRYLSEFVTSDIWL